MTWPWQWGPHVSEGEGRKEGTDSVNLNEPRTGFCSGPKEFPEALLCFFPFSSLFFFCLLDYFITLSFVLQIDSNQFLKFSKNQHIILNQ
jgi:hypothetical protein